MRHDCLSAITHGDAATLVAQRPEIALVIADVEAKGMMGGLEAVRAIRQDGTLSPDVPIIVFSAVDSRPDLSDLPGAVFVEKDLSSTSPLIAAITNALPPQPGVGIGGRL